MNALSLRTRYRPVRLGLCIPEGDADAFRRAILLTTTLWGGRFNPIIPVGKDEVLLDKLIRNLKVEQLVNVTDDDASQEFVDRHPHLASLDGQLYHHSGSRINPAYLTAARALHEINDAFIRGKPEPEVTFFRVYRDVLDPLSDVALCMYGDYPNADVVGTDYCETHKKMLGLGYQLNLDSPLPQFRYGEFTPLGATEFELTGDYSQGFDAIGYTGIFLGCSTDIAELTAFWNLRSAGYELAFFDTRHAGRCLPAVKAASREELDRSKLIGEPASLSIWSQSEFGSLSLSELGIEGVAGWRSLPSLPLLQGVSPLTMAFPEHTLLGVVDGSALKFASPRKPTEGEEWTAETLALHICPAANRETDTFTPPNFPGIDAALGRRMFPSNPFCFRTQPSGIALIQNLFDREVTLQSISAESLVTEIFSAAGMVAKPSKSGRVVSRLLQQMGGLSGCWPFHIPGVRELIASRGPQQSFSWSVAQQHIGRNWDPGFDRFRSLMGREASQRAVFDHLLDLEIFRLGSNLVCPKCELDFWVGLDDLTSRMSCPYCSEVFPSTSQIRPNLQFRRSGLFGRDDHQEGGIPVALTLRHLRSTLFDSVSITGGFEVVFDDTQGQCETDLVLVGRADTRPLLVIGECKSGGGEIEEKDVLNLAHVAQRLRGLSADVFVVFAKDGTFSSEEVERCLRGDERLRYRVILFSKEHLDRVDGPFGDSRHGGPYIGRRLIDWVTYTETQFS